MTTATLDRAQAGERKAKVKPKRKYRVLFGGHVDRVGPERQALLDKALEEGRIEEDAHRRESLNHVFNAGERGNDVVESSKDLLKFNSRNSTKFELLNQFGASVRSDPTERQPGETKAEWRARLKAEAERLSTLAGGSEEEDEKDGDDGLTALTHRQLSELAAGEGVDLSGLTARSKEALIDRIRAFRSDKA